MNSKVRKCITNILADVTNILMMIYNLKRSTDIDQTIFTILTWPYLGQLLSQQRDLYRTLAGYNNTFAISIIITAITPFPTQIGGAVASQRYYHLLPKVVVAL